MGGRPRALFKESSVAKKSLKNSKHLVELIGAATPRAIALLSTVDKFAFLGVLDTSQSADVVRSTLIDTLASDVSYGRNLVER
jgi:hypothetical protein